MINENGRVLRADDDDMTCNGPGQLVMYGNRKMGKYGMARQQDNTVLLLSSHNRTLFLSLSAHWYVSAKVIIYRNLPAEYKITS